MIEKETQEINRSRIKRNLISAFSAQGISFLISALISLIVPKVLNIEQFGFWQLFIFYSTYVGFFHFGLNDGVYLIHGGETRESIDKSSIKSQFSFACIFQALVFAILLGFSIFLSNDPNRRFVCISCLIYMVLTNLNLYWGYTFQAVNETALYSRSVIIDRLSFLLPLIIFLLLRIDVFEFYVVAYIMSKAYSLGYSIWNARDFISAGFMPFNDAIREVWGSINVGIRLMLATIADMILLGISRFFIDLTWGIATFSVVSLSFSLVNFFMNFVSQVGMVLFPALRGINREAQGRLFALFDSVLCMISPMVYILYFPIVWILSIWLPQYLDSFRYFSLLLPICVYNSEMNICGITFFKVLRKENQLLAINIITVLVSVIMSGIGCFAIASIEATLIGIVIPVVIRSLISTTLLSRQMGIGLNRSTITQLCITFLFVLVATNSDSPAASALVILAYIVYIIVNWKNATCLLNLVKSRISN